MYGHDLFCVAMIVFIMIIIVTTHRYLGRTRLRFTYVGLFAKVHDLVLYATICYLLYSIVKFHL